MAKELVLMEKGFSRMNVPLDKVQQYLDDGWTEISRTVADGGAAKLNTDSKRTPRTDKRTKSNVKKGAKNVIEPLSEDESSEESDEGEDGSE